MKDFVKKISGDDPVATLNDLTERLYSSLNSQMMKLAKILISCIRVLSLSLIFNRNKQEQTHSNTSTRH